MKNTGNNFLKKFLTFLSKLKLKLNFNKKYFFTKYIKIIIVTDQKMLHHKINNKLIHH